MSTASSSSRKTSPLATAKIMPFVSTSSPELGKQFYRDTLGFPLVHEDGFALVFDANGVTLRVPICKVVAAPYTVLGWQVSDIVATLKELAAKGVKFERYEGFMKQDELGIWDAPGGARVAWFKDPDGNLLSISQHE